jgi:N-methylhydantoinase A
VVGNGSAACYAEREVCFGGIFQSTKFYRREKLVPGDVIAGPAMVTEYTAATLLPPGSLARVDTLGNLIIDAGEEARP